MRDVFAAELMKLAGKNERIMFLTGDLGFGVFEEFRDTYPDQYLNVGVAEQNMIGVATGLALEGRVVFAYSIGNFPVLRCLEQIRNDAAYHEANVKVVSIGGGFSYGPLGISHHATEDIAIMRALPDVTAFTPGTLSDVSASVHALVATEGTGYLRLDKSHGEDVFGADAFEQGKWRVMAKGEDVTLVACGGVLGEAQRAAVLLVGRGFSARVVDATQMTGVEDVVIADALGPAQVIVTVEEHVTRGGLGSLVAEVISSAGGSKKLSRLGIAQGFMSEVGSQIHLRARAGVDAESVANHAATLLVR